MSLSSDVDVSFLRSSARSHGPTVYKFTYSSSRHRGQSNGLFWRSCVTMRKVNKFWGFGKKGERVTSLKEHVLNACIAIMRDEEIAFFARKESFVHV